jgi:membrane protein DedA with SNARE-associated domain
MLASIEAAILAALQTVFDQFGWTGVFGLMIFENATGITPSEVVLAFAGWMLIERHGFNPGLILLGGLYAGLGSAIGSSITYWAARLGGRPMVEKISRLFRVDMRHILRAEEQIHKFGAVLVLIGRVIPGVRTLISIPAGLVRIPFPKFFAATFAGASLWCTLLIGVGYLLGREWMLIGVYIRQYLPFLVGGGALAALTFLLMIHFRVQLPAWLGRSSPPESE